MRAKGVRDDLYEEVDEQDVPESGEFFLARYRAMRPDAKVIDIEKLKQALRVNTTKTDAQALMRRLDHRGAQLTRIPFLREGHYVSASFSLGATPEYLQGWYYLQGPLSQLACEALSPSVGSRALDMASAPGGKTTYLAQMVGPEGAVVALEKDARRLESVRNNAERLGLANVVCVRKDARFAHELGMRFPFVLLDAPCSGNFCSEEGWFAKRTIHDIKENARTQRELLKAAVQCLEPGGRLVYSTCSLEPEEDEMNVSWALGKYPDLDAVEFDPGIGDAGITSWEGVALDPRVARTRRFWPHLTGMEGFYIAVMEKRKA